MNGIPVETLLSLLSLFQFLQSNCFHMRCIKVKLFSYVVIIISFSVPVPAVKLFFIYACCIKIKYLFSDICKYKDINIYSYCFYSAWCRVNMKKLRDTTSGPWRYMSQSWDLTTPMSPKQRTIWHHVTWNRASTRRLKSCTNRCWHVPTSGSLAPLMVSDDPSTLVSYLSSISFKFPTALYIFVEDFAESNSRLQD